MQICTFCYAIFIFVTLSNCKHITNYRSDGSQFFPLKFDFNQVSNLREEKIFNYNLNDFDFNSEVKRVLKQHWLHEFANFGSSHDLHFDTNFFIDKNGNKINIMQHRWNKERSRDYYSSDYESFDLLYRRFIEQVVGPSLGGIK
jgi:hypothetical protein